MVPAPLASRGASASVPASLPVSRCHRAIRGSASGGGEACASEDDAGRSLDGPESARDAALPQPAEQRQKEGTLATDYIRLLFVGSDGMRRCRCELAAGIPG